MNSASPSCGRATLCSWPENGAGISPDLYEETAKDSRLCDLVLLTAEGYSQISGTPVSLAADEALCYTGGVPFGSEVTMLDRTWSVRTLEEAPLPEEGANGIPRLLSRGGQRGDAA